MHSRAVCALAAVILAAGACARGDLVGVRIETTRGTVTFRVEVADDDAERARGLMFRRSLDADHGMLFVWGDAAERRFHMKNTLIPLDLVAIRNGRVVGTYSMVPCEAEPCPVTTTLAADAALELAAGVARARGVAPGDLVDADPLR